MSFLTLENVSKNFGDFAAVKGVNLSVAADEVLCLLGPSGCGKTTTLRMIAGLETVSDGRIRFGNEDVTARPAQRRNVAMAFQFYALYPDLTVAENLVFPLGAESLSKLDKDQRLTRIADVLQLDEVLARYPHELSEGEKQRVAVGRCIIREPNAFLFDEPLSRLDVKLREEMRGSIRKILATLDRPTVIVTHDQLEAMTMGDRIAVMRDGVIEQAGKPADVFDRPANTFVASFIGTPQMTLLEGVFRSAAAGRINLRFADVQVDMPMLDLVGMPQPGARITLGFRPRAAELNAVGNVNFNGATLALAENMGAESLLHFDWNGQAIRILQQGQAHIAEGQSATISVAASDITLFGSDNIRIPHKGDPA